MEKVIKKIKEGEYEITKVIEEKENLTSEMLYTKKDMIEIQLAQLQQELEEVNNLIEEINQLEEEL